MEKALVKKIQYYENLKIYKENHVEITKREIEQIGEIINQLKLKQKWHDSKDEAEDEDVQTLKKEEVRDLLT